MLTIPPFLLSPEEVQEITGFKLPRLQVDYLQRKGWRFEVNAIGRPIVARKYAERMLGCGDEPAQVVRPNFGALRAV
ncbi:DUF4224 domain-containing protein [Ramlibacter sp. AW1]|uniref:DUF4224 domain-containing protein n=1 Tax=Ramlibacter aurantiacus TaxID=2801330 RepID=A0A936ZPD8_9BURK|nr:DUF4224 domain-containing protein [Ramlibacter aurantiacus]